MMNNLPSVNSSFIIYIQSLVLKIDYLCSSILNKEYDYFNYKK